MIVSQPQSSSGEKIFATFYLSRNATFQGLHQIPIAIGQNLRGMPLVFIMAPASIKKGFGIDVGNTGAMTADETMAPAGVLETPLIIGKVDAVQNVWVTAQVYGVSDRVLIGSGAVEANLITLWTDSSFVTDFAIGFSKAALVFQRRLVGTLTLGADPVVGETINLDGSASTAGTWTVAPGVSTTQAGDFLAQGPYGFLGLTPTEAAVVPPDNPSGAAGYRRGFIMAMGMPFVHS